MPIALKYMKKIRVAVKSNGQMLMDSILSQDNRPLPLHGKVVLQNSQVAREKSPPSYRTGFIGQLIFSKVAAVIPICGISPTTDLQKGTIFIASFELLITLS